MKQVGMLAQDREKPTYLKTCKARASEMVWLGDVLKGQGQMA